MKKKAAVGLMALAAAVVAGALVVPHLGSAPPRSPSAGRWRPTSGYLSEQYRRWSNGPPADPGYFPIAVWMQNPGKNAQRYKDIGINLFLGLWDGPQEAQLAALKAAGLPTIANQNKVALTSPNSRLIKGYLLADEPDMNQADGSASGAGCILPSVIQREAGSLREADPSRPIYLNLGKGAAIPKFGGRGPGCYQRTEADMYEYAKAADILSVDYYAITDPYEPPSNKGIWAYGRSIDRMRAFVHGAKPVWGFVETTAIWAESDAKPTPAEVRSVVWMSLIHGARGIEYFAHSFRGGLREEALLDDPAMVAMVKSLNQQITQLAPVLNTPSAAGAVHVTSANAAVPVDTMVKRSGGVTYLFAIGGRPGSATATFKLEGVSAGTAEVLGEHRALPVRDGSFTDAFHSSYEVHLYRIAG
jgi:Beta-galactosidase